MSERRLLSVEEVQERLQHGWHVGFLPNGQPYLPYCSISNYAVRSINYSFIPPSVSRVSPQTIGE